MYALSLEISGNLMGHLANALLDRSPANQNFKFFVFRRDRHSGFAPLERRLLYRTGLRMTRQLSTDNREALQRYPFARVCAGGFPNKAESTARTVAARSAWGRPSRPASRIACPGT